MKKRTSLAARTRRSAPNALDSTTAAMLPLARLCLGGGGGVENFILAVKLAFVQAAAENARLGSRLNVSAIAASTGLIRREVGALLELASEQEKRPARDHALSPIMRVVEGWRTAPAFLDGAGRPAVLSMTGTGSFTDLVQRFAGDVTVVAVLKSLQRLGWATKGARATIRLKSHIRQRELDYEVQLIEVMERVRDLATTLVDNVEEPEHPLYAGVQRAAIPSEQAVLFQAEFSERASSLVESLQRWAASQMRIGGDRPQTSLSSREVGVGVYLINRPTPEAVPRRAQVPRRSRR